MFSPVTRAGRRRAQTSRRLPDLATVSSISRPTVVKGLVGLGLASSVAAAIAIPVQASPDQVELSSQTSALVARDRAEAVSGTTSRSAGRSAVSTARTALSAPAAGESAAVSAGTAGVTAVAKPKPAPKPTPKPKPKPKPTVAKAEKVEPKVEKKSASTSTTTRSTTKRATTSTRSSASSSTSSSGSGASMAYYDAGRAKGLGDNAAKVYSAIRSNFGITNIGGYRAGAGDHGSGRAVDVMVTGSRGDAVAQWAINNMGAYDITYVIWKQRIWLAGSSGWRAMDDRGSVTANHYDHVHISVE